MLAEQKQRDDKGKGDKAGRGGNARCRDRRKETVKFDGLEKKRRRPSDGRNPASAESEVTGAIRKIDTKLRAWGTFTSWWKRGNAKGGLKTKEEGCRRKKLDKRVRG